MPRNTTTVSSKHQITIPAEAFDAAGLRVGDKITAKSDGPGRVVLERVDDPVLGHAGALTGMYDGARTTDLRAEWD